MRRLLCWLGFHQPGEPVRTRQVYVKVDGRWESAGMPWNRMTICERCGEPLRFWTEEDA